MISIEELYLLYREHKPVFIDSRLAGKGGIFFALKGDRFDGNDFVQKAIADGANYAVVDREDLANKQKCIFVDDALETLQDLAHFHRRQLSIPVLAITGTNGKTTTKELISSVLSQKFNVLATNGNLNNHIGVPLTLLAINSGHEIAVIEMGANQIGEIDFLCKIARPDYGIITNVGKAHLEGFGSFEGVKKAKGELFRFIAQNRGNIFINTDNHNLVEMAANNAVQLTYASSGETAQLKGELAGNDVYVVAKVLFEKGWLYIQTKLTGAYNLENILAAARIGLHFGIDPLLIKKGIEIYEPSNNRSQFLKKGTSTILLDCYNANPSSMEVSIQNFIQIDKSNKVLVLGDMLELGAVSAIEHQKIIDLVQTSNIHDVFLIGANFMGTKVPENFLKFNDVENFKEGIVNFSFDNKFILVKGSRGIQLEKLIEMI